MATSILSAGSAHSITQNVVYALPPQAVFIHSTVALEVSVDGTNFAAVTATTTGVTVGAMFVRCTTAAAVVAVKRLD